MCLTGNLLGNGGHLPSEEALNRALENRQMGCVHKLEYCKGKGLGSRRIGSLFLFHSVFSIKHGAWHIVGAQ